MPVQPKLFALAIAFTVSTTAQAAVMPAYVNSRVADSGGLAYPSSYSDSAQFGVHRLASPNGSATATTGTDASGAPTIRLQIGTSSTKSGVPYADANMGYGWEVVGAEGTPVLVHIATSGYLKYAYSFTPDKFDTYNLSENIINAGVIAYFGTHTTSGSGYDQRQYGLQSGGNLNWGIERVQPTSNFSQQNGGDSMLEASFSSTFDLWVTPNRENYIGMGALAFLYENSSFLKDYTTEQFWVDAFIDPIITIDTQYGDAYQLNVSAIPAAGTDVPEPSNLFLFFGGLGILFATRLPAKRCAKLADLNAVG